MPDRRAVADREGAAALGQERRQLERALRRRPGRRRCRSPRRSRGRAARRGRSAARRRAGSRPPTSGRPTRTLTVQPRSAASRTPATTSSSSAASRTAAGIPVGPAGVEDPPDAGLLVAVVAAQDQPSLDVVAHPDDRRSRRRPGCSPRSRATPRRWPGRGSRWRRPRAAPTCRSGTRDRICSLGPSGSVQQRAGVRRLGHRRADRVDPDAVRTALDDQVAGQREHAALGRAVRVLRHEPGTPRAGDRADVDDRRRRRARPGAARPRGSPGRRCPARCGW